MEVNIYLKETLTFYLNQTSFMISGPIFTEILKLVFYVV